jgi:hypothetical protein
MEDNGENLINDEETYVKDNEIKEDDQNLI